MYQLYKLEIVNLLTDEDWSYEFTDEEYRDEFKQYLVRTCKEIIISYSATTIYLI